MKKTLTILGLMVVFVVVLAVGKNFVAKTAVENGTELVTGLPLKIKNLNISILQTLVGIKDLRLFNPKGFQDKVMVWMPEIFVNYEFGTILKGKIHVEEIRINLQEFTVVRNEKGELNLDRLKALQPASKPSDQPKDQKPAPQQKAPEMQIDKLELKIGKVVFKDYSKGGTPSIKEFNLNLNESYTDITNPNKLVALIVFKALAGTPIAALTNFDLGSLQAGVGDVLGSAQQMATQKAGEAADYMKEKTGQATEAAAESAKEISDKTKEAASGLKDKLKNPFD